MPVRSERFFTARFIIHITQVHIVSPLDHHKFVLNIHRTRLMQDKQREAQVPIDEDGLVHSIIPNANLDAHRDDYTGRIKWEGHRKCETRKLDL